MKNIIRLFCVISFFISSIVYADIKFWTTDVQPARMAKQEEMYIPFNWGTVTWLSSTNTSALSGRYSNNVGGDSPLFLPDKNLE